MIQTSEYSNWLKDLKNQIQSNRLKAALSVNSILVKFYLNIGKQIFEKQLQTNWGDKLISQLSKEA